MDFILNFNDPKQFDPDLAQQLKKLDKKINPKQIYIMGRPIDPETISEDEDNKSSCSSCDENISKEEKFKSVIEEQKVPFQM